jgi:Holliday junction resolvase RusA-like endonuclease
MKTTASGKQVANILQHPDAKTARYEDRLAWAAQIVMAGRPLLEGALIVAMDIYRIVPASKPRKWREAALRDEIRPITKPDYDNYAKILDALNRVVWVDDSQIVDSRVRKFYSDRPRIEIRVDNLSTDGL